MRGTERRRQEAGRDGGQVKWVWSRDETKMSGGDCPRGRFGNAPHVSLTVLSWWRPSMIGAPKKGLPSSSGCSVWRISVSPRQQRRQRRLWLFRGTKQVRLDVLQILRKGLQGLSQHVWHLQVGRRDAYRLRRRRMSSLRKPIDLIAHGLNEGRIELPLEARLRQLPPIPFRQRLSSVHRLRGGLVHQGPRTPR